MSNNKSIEELYDLNDRLYALEVLKECDFNYNLAQSKTGISPVVLRGWAKKMLPMLDDGSDKLEVAITSSEEALDENYNKVIKEIRHLMLEKMRDLVLKEKDLDKTTRALRTLHEIATGNTPWGKEAPQSANRFYQQVNNVILQISNKNES